MTLASHAQRIRSNNPVEPYLWEARYQGYDDRHDRHPRRFRLRQQDFDGWHTSREIDRARLRSLVIWGHPGSPIELGLPQPPPPDGPLVDEVLVQATTDLRETIEVGEQRIEYLTWCFFGFRYGGLRHFLQIDPAGHIAAYVADVVQPIECPRCGPGQGGARGLVVPW
jgi:hypothetical protein